MINDSFYIELSSNAASYINTVANFKNDISLVHPLNGNWEVALVEISYTKSWRNLIEDCHLCIENIVTTNTKGLLSKYKKEFKLEECATVKKGYYDTPNELISELQKAIRSIGLKNYISLPEIKYNKFERIVRVKSGLDKEELGILIEFSDEIKEILGLITYSTLNPVFNENKEVVADRIVNLNEGLHTLFVYCDIIEPQYIGDTRA